MDMNRINQLRLQLKKECISLNELHEIESAGESSGIKVTDEMLADDILDALEQKLTSRVIHPWKDIYNDGECPDCSMKIPQMADDGHECTGCGHVCHIEKQLFEDNGGIS